MFTGVIRAVSDVRKSEKRRGSLFLEIQKPRAWKVKIGDSVAVNGTCLTIKKIQRGMMVFELMPETLSKTTFGKIVPRAVNLELPLRLSDRLDGHFVTGHVDTVGKITDIKKRGVSKVFDISFPRKFAKLVVPKGSIAIDGVSLTIVAAFLSRFSVSLVSYTLKNTILGERKVGDVVNLEFDILAKYGARSSKRTI
ncbi:MAG: riboflavin synthase [Nanoarchaeota archaeon]|nr:riboflavin synthase [Nanoarchaeota archaeon]